MGSFFGTVVALAVLGAVLTAVERIWPERRPAALLSRSRLLDLAYWVIGPTVGRLLASAVTFVVVVLVVLALRAPLEPSQFEAWQHARSPLRALPPPVQAALTLVALDLAGYWVHRLLHGPRLLWRVHAVHHSTRELDWLSAARNHPLNEALGHALIGAALVAAGLDPRAVAAIGPVFGIWAIVLHANVRWRFGRLRFVLATPAFHRWHHAQGGPAGGCNFAPLLPVWDLLFGTFHLPPHQPSEFGAGEPMPESIVGQLMFPLRRGASKGARQ